MISLTTNVTLHFRTMSSRERRETPGQSLREKEKKKKSGGPVTLQTVFSCLRICLFVQVFAFQRIRFLREVASFGEIRGSQ